ncbi:heterokaryon incompatibility protein-domain-containing protein, partial [Macrophomina phaseolina]
QIRLLKLHPGQEDERVRCDLVNVNLDELPKFDAISYTWANSNGDECVAETCNCPHPVAANCCAVPRRIRLPWPKRLLWVDAVCIDRNPIEESNHQGREMERIYRGASRVVVYLGEAGGVDNRLFEFLDGENAYPPRLLAVYAEALRRLVSRGWFECIWVMQEFGLSM